MTYRFPVYAPDLSGNEKKYVNECLDTTWISGKGSFIDKFEKSFADYIGVNHAVTCSNGTVALHLALIALGIGPGDKVIVPTLTYVASANAVKYTGAEVVFVDSVRNTWQIDVDEVIKLIDKDTKVVMAVHLYGHPCEMEKLRKVCNEKDIFLMEDCAEGLGTKFNGKHVGTFGEVSTFSFYGNKTITTGEGGMVVTNDETLYKRLMHFKGQGLAHHREYWHDVIGYNYRMTNICAAIGLAQLERIDSILEKKRQIAAMYKKDLEGLPVEFHSGDRPEEHSYWMCSILVEQASVREPLRAHLKAEGIETRPLFYPVHTMPMYSEAYRRFRVAEELGWLGINLPSYPGLSEKDVHTITAAVRNFYKDRKGH